MIEPGGGTAVGAGIGAGIGAGEGAVVGGAAGGTAGWIIAGKAGRWADDKLGYGDQSNFHGQCMSSEKSDDKEDQKDNKPKSDKTRWSPGKPGDPEKNADAHWDKHQSEFPEHSDADDYVNGADDFVDNPPPATLTKPGQNGGTLMYDPQTNTFGSVDANGNPRTIFRPKNGIDY